ncbi:MAG: glycosyltransferase family 39 protein [Anaerolineae bacterium]
MNPSLRRDSLIALTLGTLALAVRVLFLARSPFDGLYGQDAYAYFDHAQAIRVALSSGTPLPPFFWPIGYPGILAAFFALFGPSATVGQLASLLMGAALAPIAYGLARASAVTWPGALVAGLLMVANGQAIQSSLVLMADIPALFWASLSAFALLRALRTRRTAAFALAGMLLGIAVVTRWANLLLIIPFAAAIVRSRSSWRGAIATAAAFGLVLLPQLLISANSPYPTFNHAWVQGWSPLNAFARDFVNVDGTFHYAQVNGLFAAGPATELFFFAPLAIPLIALGVYALRAPSRWLLGGWAVLGWAFLAGIPYQNIRFGLLLSPPLAVLAGAGFGWLWTRLSRHKPARWALIAAVGIGFGWMLTASAPPIEAFIARQQADRDAVMWAASRIPSNSRVYTSGLTLALRHTVHSSVHELYGLEPSDLAEEAETGDYVLVNRWQIENQWAGTPMQDAIHGLETARGLTLVARYGNYTLYQVKR